MPDPAAHRTRIVTTRFRPDEWAAICERAREAGLAPSRYLRQVALGAVPQPRPQAVNREALYQLGRIGNNLNQLAKLSNSGSPLPRSEILETLAAVRAAVDRL
jgi:hypothetical protein